MCKKNKFLVFLVLMLCNIVFSGEYVKSDLSSYSLGVYLAECEVNKPEILKNVLLDLKNKGYYKKSVKDQKNKPTVLTVFVDENNTLHVLTYREQTCPDCKGSGIRPAPFGKITSKLAVDFRCVRCKGKGYLPRQTFTREFILSSSDYSNPELAEKELKEQFFQNAPADTENYINMLANNSPEIRLDACIWLDENYVKIGEQFQKIMPMLKKARYQEVSKEKEVMVWQFWAAKGDNKKKDFSYYRVYANSKTGKIIDKGFYRGN